MGGMTDHEPDAAASSRGAGPAYDCLWWDGTPVRRRPGLDGDRHVDVAIIGAGFTGLWTAYWLGRLDPDLRVLVIEAEHAGFGASGRNGGWASALFPTAPERIARAAGGGQAGRDAAQRLMAVMRRGVADLIAVTRLAGIECDLSHGGMVVAARSTAQVARAQEEVAHARSWGVGEEHLRMLGRDEARRMLGATDVLAATYSPDCATVHPGRLVRGLAEAVERQGVQILEGTRAELIEPGRILTRTGTVTADVILPATEAWTASIPGLHGRIAPVYSLMLATEPLSQEAWREIGLERRPAFSEHRHLVIYGQRTADGRIAFGGRGAPYHLGSRIRPGQDLHGPTHTALRETLVDLFPVLRDVAITHRWGGPLGIPRDWFPSCGLDRSTGMAWAGGYVGDGVVASSVAGRTVAELITGIESERTSLPWVGHRSPEWEPEPLRWIGINAARLAMARADASEQRHGRVSRTAAVVHRLIGH